MRYNNDFEELKKYSDYFDLVSYYSLANSNFSPLVQLRQGMKSSVTNDKPINYSGFYVKVPNNRCRIILGDVSDSFLYRGENKEYPFLPTLKRANINHSIEWIKADMFKESYKKLPYYRNVQDKLGVEGYKFEIDLEALAQHYGFCSNYIDLTLDKDVAKFFAYTYSKKGKIYPITNFNTYSPRIYKVQRHKLIAYDPNIFQIIGFQLAKRPQVQNAVAIDMSNLSNDIREKLFDIELLPTSSKEAEKIYEKFKGGESLFPKEKIAVLAKHVKNAITLNEDSIRKYSYTYHKNFGKLRCNLKNQYKIDNKLCLASKENWKRMQEETNLLIRWVYSNIAISYEARMGTPDCCMEFLANKISYKQGVIQVANIINNNKK